MTAQPDDALQTAAKVDTAVRDAAGKVYDKAKPVVDQAVANEVSFGKRVGAWISANPKSFVLMLGGLALAVLFLLPHLR